MTPLPPFSLVGLGAMGQALAATALDAGHLVTVWNRSPGRSAALAARGARVAATVADAVVASPIVVTCLLDHASVHETLDPHRASLAGRTLVNLTTTTPNQARELDGWAIAAGIDHLDGGIMAVPSMIGGPGAAILYSGSEAAFEQHRGLLDRWGDSAYLGADPGMASLQDMAMLLGMYTMFAGFLHGAAMVASAGVSAVTYAARATPFLAAMTGGFEGFASIVDRRAYAEPGQQSLEFSDLGDLLQASRDAGVRTDLLAAMQRLIVHEVAAGHGTDGLARIFEAMRSAT